MLSTNENRIYIMGDGDKIRESIESCLFSNDLEGAKKLSLDLTTGVARLKEKIEIEVDGNVVIAGGDDILFTMRLDKFDINFIKELYALFHYTTGKTISFGIGNDIEHAYLNLRRAKASKTDKISIVGLQI